MNNRLRDFVAWTIHLAPTRRYKETAFNASFLFYML